MAWLIFMIVVIVLVGVAAGLLFWRGRIVHRRDRYDGDGYTILAGIAALIGVSLIAFTAGIAVDRHVSKHSCGIKAEVSGRPYIWVDYHFFGYECLLRTPSGNVTDTPVLPIENVTQDPTNQTGD
jgi:hypothetical protein